MERKSKAEVQCAERCQYPYLGFLFLPILFTTFVSNRSPGLIHVPDATWVGAGVGDVLGEVVLWVMSFSPALAFIWELTPPTLQAVGVPWVIYGINTPGSEISSVFLS